MIRRDNMANSISEDLKKIMLAGIGAVAATADKSREMVGTLVKRGELSIEQGKVINEELKRNIKDTLKDRVSVTVVKDGSITAKNIMENLPKLSKDEIAELKNKLAEMEKAEPNGSETGAAK
jgi:polyhydroxyalkanoate synthesis regulator phasin